MARARGFAKKITQARQNAGEVGTDGNLVTFVRNDNHQAFEIELNDEEARRIGELLFVRQLKAEQARLGALHLNPNADPVEVVEATHRVKAIGRAFEALYPPAPGCKVEALYGRAPLPGFHIGACPGSPDVIAECEDGAPGYLDPTRESYWTA